jgi:hypothetical protein
MDHMEELKFFIVPGLELRPSAVVQPVASRYTDYATLVLDQLVRILNRQTI